MDNRDDGRSCLTTSTFIVFLQQLPHGVLEACVRSRYKSGTPGYKNVGGRAVEQKTVEEGLSILYFSYSSKSPTSKYGN